MLVVERGGRGMGEQGGRGAKCDRKFHLDYQPARVLCRSVATASEGQSHRTDNWACWKESETDRQTYRQRHHDMQRQSLDSSIKKGGNEKLYVFMALAVRDDRSVPADPTSSLIRKCHKVC